MFSAEAVAWQHGKILVCSANVDTDLGGGVHSKAKLGLLAIVNGQALQQQGAQARASATTDGVEDQEALEACKYQLPSVSSTS